MRVLSRAVETQFCDLIQYDWRIGPPTEAERRQALVARPQGRYFMNKENEEEWEEQEEEEDEDGEEEAQWEEEEEEDD